MKLKYKLPAYSEIDHLKLTDAQLENLKKIIIDLNAQFESVLEVNKKLCGIHHNLATSVYDNFFQIGLTESPHNEITNLNECGIIDSELKHGSKTESLRNKLKVSNDINSPLNEKTYTEKTSLYLKYSNTFNEIFSKFRSKPTRIRLVQLKAGTNVAPHIDYDPSYSVRIIIPIISTEECINLFWTKNKIESVWLKPGNAYFLNTGYKHAVVNLSNEDRYTLLISVDGIEDIKELLNFN